MLLLVPELLAVEWSAECCCCFDAPLELPPKDGGTLLFSLLLKPLVVRFSSAEPIIPTGFRIEPDRKRVSGEPAKGWGSTNPAKSEMFIPGVCGGVGDSCLLVLVANADWDVFARLSRSCLRNPGICE
jgi:hypothetical protein